MKNSKNFKSYINPTIISDRDNQEIIEIITPPELLTGLVCKVMDDLSKKCEQHAKKYTKFCGVTVDTTRKGTGYNGNACRDILENVDALRENRDLICLKYIEVLEVFKHVVKGCFSIKLDIGYSSKIKKFKKCYLDSELGHSITSKAHAVFYHVEYFCNKEKRV